MCLLLSLGTLPAIVGVGLDCQMGEEVPCGPVQSCRFPRQGLGRVKELSQDLSGLAQICRIACILVSSSSSKAGEL